MQKLLTQAYKSNSNSPKELTFLDGVFKTIDKQNPFFLSRPGVAKQILSLVHKHLDKAKSREIEHQKKLKNKKNKKPTQSKNSETEEKEKSETVQKSKTTSTGTSTSTSTTTSTSTSTSTNTNTNTTEKKIPEYPVIKEPEEGTAPIGNGGKTDKYVWTQTLKDVEIFIEVPSNLRGKHFIVDFTPKRLKVGIKGQPLIINGELDNVILPDDCQWILDKDKFKTTKTLQITLVKKNGMEWWKRVIVGDAEIDTKTIQPENSKMEDLDDDTRQTVQKMMFDQRQKMMGKPTTKELQQQQILEKFKQQHPEFNFDNVKLG